MKEHLSEKRFKTAGARIFRTKKLPKDFFVSRQRDLSSASSVNSSKDQQQKPSPTIFQFTFMAKQNVPLRKTKSGFLDSMKHLTPLKKPVVQKENATLSLPMLKSIITKNIKQTSESSVTYKRRLQKISLTQLNKY